MQVSKQDIYRFSPCSVATEKLVNDCFGDREFLSAKDVLSLSLGDEYKLWLLLRPELIKEEDLEKIRQEFISIMDQEWLIKYCVEHPVHTIIGRVARCFDRPYEKTYAELIKIVEKYIA